MSRARLVAPIDHAVVEARDRHVSVGVVHRREDAGERHRGIHHAAAVHAGVQIARRTLHVDLEVREPAQRRENRRQPRREHRRVGDDHRVAGQHLLVGLDELGKVLAADFLLALGEDDHVHRQRAARREVRLERFDVEIELAFVVDRTAREDLAVAHRRLEGRAVPQLERLGGLHVVVAVDEHRLRARLGLAPFTDDDRVALRRMDRRVHTDLVQRLGDPAGGARRVGVVLRARADAGNAEEVEQLVAGARLVLGEKALEIGGKWHDEEPESDGQATQLPRPRATGEQLGSVLHLDAQARRVEGRDGRDVIEIDDV